MHHVFIAACVGGATFAGVSGLVDARVQSGRVSPVAQAAAMELGFAAGSMLAQVALPRPQRQISAAGFARSDADLARFARVLGIAGADVTNAFAAMRQGFADENPVTGAQRVSDGMNLIRTHLASGSRPRMMNVFRAGSVVGHTLETAAAMANGSPTRDDLLTFNALAAAYRTSMPDDLARAGLPANVADAVRRTNMEVDSADDLRRIVDACLMVKRLVEMMRAAR